MVKSKHWVSWDKMCHPEEQGGSLEIFFNIFNSMFAKLWCIYRTTISLWIDFIWNKYCKNIYQ